MKPFGIVVYPQQNAMMNGDNRYPALAAADGTFSVGQFDVEDIEGGRGYPTAVFFERELWRDQELHAMLLRWPNVMFCPITITTGQMTKPNPEPSKFSISEKGILPA